MAESNIRKIALIGGGPSALFLYKQLVRSGHSDLEVHIFERKSRLGQGMPYSPEGANLEHCTNVSGSELPPLVTPLDQWVRNQSSETLAKYGLRAEEFDQEQLLPRLLFGDYLEAQFHDFISLGQHLGLTTILHLDCPVLDIVDRPSSDSIVVRCQSLELIFDHVILCSGHRWPRDKEGEVAGYFASPYPPRKLARKVNHAVALKGSSLTAIDAIRTLARSNGRFVRQADRMVFEVAEGSEEFRLVMHTRGGLLPCVRVHFDEPRVTDHGLLPKEEWMKARLDNDGFVPLDLIFEEDFKKLLVEDDPELYEKIKEHSLEEFVAAALKGREQSDSFEYFRREFQQALESVRRRKAVPWKEALASLSYAVNYPAKHFSAEDYLRYKAYLHPLMAIVIAFVPKESSEELLALHDCGRLEIIEVGEESSVDFEADHQFVYRFKQDGREQKITYQIFIDCTGQPHLSIDDLPFPSLREQGVVSQARLRFRSPPGPEVLSSEKVEQDSDGRWYLLVPGAAINDVFQPLDRHQRANPRLTIMAVPYIGGHNPDYSGVDFCEKASEIIVGRLLGVPA